MLLAPELLPQCDMDQLLDIGDIRHTGIAHHSSNGLGNQSAVVVNERRQVCIGRARDLITLPRLGCRTGIGGFRERRHDSHIVGIDKRYRPIKTRPAQIAGCGGTAIGPARVSTVNRPDLSRASKLSWASRNAAALSPLFFHA